MNETPLEWSVDTGPLAHSSVDFSYEAKARELAALKRHAGVEDVPAFKARVKNFSLVRRPIPRIGSISGERGASKRRQS